MVFFKQSRAPAPANDSEVDSRASGSSSSSRSSRGRNSWFGRSGSRHEAHDIDDSGFASTRFEKVQDRAIGEILRKAKGLTEHQITQVLAYQSKHNIRFGDAAVALGFAKSADVMWALSQQFHYHYAPGSDKVLHDELVMANQPFSDEVEIFRDLRSQLTLELFSPGQKRCAVAVVSSDIGDGKTFIAANLAVAFSQLPGRTLIIDADMRSPRLHEVFGLENGSGLSAILAGRIPPNVIRPVTALPNLFMLPVGALPPNPLELVQNPGFELLVQELVSKFNYVVVDTPAAAHGSDARVIAARCGAALVVGRKDNTRATKVQQLVNQLNKGNTRLAGVVMNDF
jgi:protein-tyrosine kinase